jgi:hypothetical protein
MTASALPLRVAAQAVQAGPAALAPAPADPLQPPVAVGGASRQFSDALEAALQAQSTLSNGSATAAAPAQGVGSADAQARARRGLQLDNPGAPRPRRRAETWC